MDKLLLTPREASTALGISRSKLYQLLAIGDLDSVHIGASRRVPAEALTTYVRSLGVHCRRLGASARGGRQ